MRAPAAAADVKVPAIFGPHMVLQRDQKDRVWGWAEPGEDVTVKIGGQSHATKAGADGSWQVMLDPMPAGGPHTLSIEGKNTAQVRRRARGRGLDLLGAVEHAVVRCRLPMTPTSKSQRPSIPSSGSSRFPTAARRSLRKTSMGSGSRAGRIHVGGFTAVGYFFGRRLHQMLDVPIGLINDSWGGSACEAWIRRDILAADEKYAPLLKRWEKLEKDFPASAKLEDGRRQSQGRGQAAATRPQNLEDLMQGNSRPGNIYNGVLKPTIGYGIRGVIWYQGESNAGRAYQYRDLFPLMIKSWRDEWGQGDFSFYWVQLADFLAETPEPKESTWAELREAQTMTLKLPKTGEAVIIDLGEGKDIHPKNKQDVANRLARWALARDYGVKIAFQSPTYKAMEKHGNKIVLRFDHVGHGLKTV